MTAPKRDPLIPEDVGLSWVDGRAACGDADPDLFFDRPVRESRAARKKRRDRAKRICATCPLQRDCLEHAVEFPEKTGVWGGLDEDERRRVRRARSDADWPCGHCGLLGRREGIGPHGVVLISSCFRRWKRAGRPDHVPEPDPVRSRAARGAA